MCSHRHRYPQPPNNIACALTIYTLGVDFINVLRAEIPKAQKAACEHISEIDPCSHTFINILLAFFCTKVICIAFLFSLFGFVILWKNNVGKKAAHKMLVKLTIGVNFINVFT